MLHPLPYCFYPASWRLELNLDTWGHSCAHGYQGSPVQQVKDFVWIWSNPRRWYQLKAEVMMGPKFRLLFLFKQVIFISSASQTQSSRLCRLYLWKNVFANDTQQPITKNKKTHRHYQLGEAPAHPNHEIPAAKSCPTSQGLPELRTSPHPETQLIFQAASNREICRSAVWNATCLSSSQIPPQVW